MGSPTLVPPVEPDPGHAGEGSEVKDEKANWGIEPVPERLRVLGLFDLTLLWGNLGVSLLVIVIGSFLVPALSLPEAVAAIVVGSLIGNAMLAAAGMIGAHGRVPGMVLTRAPLGERGSYAPTVLNVAQCIGWATFELIIIAAAASALSDELFGVGARWAWTLFFGVIALAMALLGPIGFVRRFIRKFAVVAVPVSVVYLTWWALRDASLGELWRADGEGGQTIWLGMDLVIAITVSWVPLAADYTRFGRNRSSAFWGTGLGYFVAGTWMLLLGSILVLSRGVAEPKELPAAVVAGGVAAILALVAVTVDETDEAFANVYSAAVSVQNLFPRVPQRLLIVAISVVATIGALAVDLERYQSFLYLLGAFFVPLLGVLLADWLLARHRYEPAEIFRAPELRPDLLLTWLIGFAVYQWLHPIGPGWWVDAVEAVRPQTYGLDTIGVSLPSFAAAFALTAFAGLLGRRAVPSRA